MFTLFNSDGTQYIPETGAIVGIKSDGLGIINSGSVVDGKVVIAETQQMTAAPGKAVFELMIDNGTHGTANFIVLVEPKPGNNADMSESDLSLLQEAIDATSPLPTGGSVGQVLTKTANGSTWSDAGTPTQAQVAEAVSDWADENITVTTGVVIDQSLSVQGAAADAKKTGDEISDLKNAISGGGMSAEFKQALENLLSKVAYIDENGQTYLNALHTAMYPPANLTRITAVYTQSGTVYITDSLDVLKADLVVTAFYDNSTSEIISTYVLSGTLTEGTSTITVTYGGKTTTFNVTVTDPTVLPSEYQKVEWIGVENSTSVPTAYLSAGQVINANDSLYVELKPFNFIGNYDSPLGYTSNDSAYQTWELYYQTVNELKKDGAFVAQFSYSIGDWDSAQMTFGNGVSCMRILSYSPNRYAFSGKIKTLQITNSGGSVTHQYVPCYRKSDDEIGMYDLITGTFLTNAGTGSFVKGNNV